VPSHFDACSGYTILVPALSAIARSVCATTVITAIPVANAKAKPKTKAIFFMVVSPSRATETVAEPTKAISDRHHVLRLFAQLKRNALIITARNNEGSHLP
jgi:hypothetical protein